MIGNPEVRGLTEAGGAHVSLAGPTWYAVSSQGAERERTGFQSQLIWLADEWRLPVHQSVTWGILLMRSIPHDRRHLSLGCLPDRLLCSNQIAVYMCCCFMYNVSLRAHEHKWMCGGVCTENVLGKEAMLRPPTKTELTCQTQHQPVSCLCFNPLFKFSVVSSNISFYLKMSLSAL